MDGMITETARMAATALALAFLAESLTEYFFAKTKAAPYMVYIAPLLGIFLAVNFNTDLFSTFMGLDGILPYSGQVLSGILYGRGANWLHDFFTRLAGAQED